MAEEARHVRSQMSYIPQNNAITNWRSIGSTAIRTKQNQISVKSRISGAFSTFWTLLLRRPCGWSENFPHLLYNISSIKHMFHSLKKSLCVIIYINKIQHPQMSICSQLFYLPEYFCKKTSISLNKILFKNYSQFKYLKKNIRVLHTDKHSLNYTCNIMPQSDSLDSGHTTCVFYGVQLLSNVAY